VPYRIRAYIAMLQINDKEFEELVAAAIDKVPAPYDKHLGQVAFIIEDEPTPTQRQQLNLYPNETLFGLYEGVPLPQRGGTEKILPDKITIFKRPLLAVSSSKMELSEKIGRTIWHEVAHYYGLDHAMIHRLESKH